MQRIIELIFVLTASSALSGCFSLGRPMVPPENNFVVSRTVNLRNGGSMEVALDQSKLIPQQRSALIQLRSIAIWPDANGLAAVISDTVTRGSTLQVVPPSRVLSSLNKMGVKGDITQLTRDERLRLSQRVIEDTGAEAVLFLTSGGQKITARAPSNSTQAFDVTVHARGASSFIAEMPGTVKMKFVATSAQTTGVNQAVGEQIGKLIIALTDNLERGIVVANAPAEVAAGAPSFGAKRGPEPIVKTELTSPSRQESARPLSQKEVQGRLKQRGFNTGKVDGKLGPRSIAAIKSFQKSKGLNATGKLDAETMKLLQEGERDLTAAR
jgi:hypothetical protein